MPGRPFDHPRRPASVPPRLHASPAAGQGTAAPVVVVVVLMMMNMMMMSGESGLELPSRRLQSVRTWKLRRVPATWKRRWSPSAIPNGRDAIPKKITSNLDTFSCTR